MNLIDPLGFAQMVHPVAAHDPERAGQHVEVDGKVATALDRNTTSDAHMTGTCPMGRVLGPDRRVRGIEGLRVAHASVMPTTPSGSTYLGCALVAGRLAHSMTFGR